MKVEDLNLHAHTHTHTHNIVALTKKKTFCFPVPPRYKLLISPPPPRLPLSPHLFPRRLLILTLIVR